MTAGLLTAGGGRQWESDLVALLDRPGGPFRVVQRCADLADVLAEAVTGRAAAVVLSDGLRRLDTDAVQRLRVSGVAVVAVHTAGDQRAPVRLDRIGIDAVVADDAGPDALVAVLREALLDLTPPSLPGVSDPERALDAAPRRDAPVASDPSDLSCEGSGAGAVVAVWGPTGAPGRSTVAAGLAVAAAAAGTPTLLVDADVYGGVLSAAFGLLDESPGLTGACRAAAGGRLDRTELTRLSWRLAPGLSLLSGISRPDRWPEVRPSAVPGVLQVARSCAALTVLDTGFCLEVDEELSFDTMAPRRNGATLAALAGADVVLAVGSADPPGIERLVRGLDELAERVPEADVRVVLNRVRRDAAGRVEAQDAFARFSALPVVALLPEDRAVTDRAWRQARPVADIAPAAPLVKGLAALADFCAAVPARDRTG
ncbi:chromosome partitioning protein [Nakamurella sp. YIM 132087]|uniref:Chromosome partitioning protein n=1 Tax=Nakamurella alba TaxID=2665158 RepID=A0A7K1FFY6_9ACTN|nr:chromosome partitioning protein [Nakamurella alba]MTD12980.1 chromosome partitioning protein [Nakamurella alba]